MPIVISFLITLIYSVNLAAQVELTFYDVGEGAATLVSGKNSNVIIDVGNPVSAPELLNKLKSKVNRLSAIYITHPHPDHIGGLFFVLNHFSHLKKYDNGQELEYIAPNHWYLDQYRKSRYVALQTGSQQEYDDFSIEILAPPATMLGQDWNINSLVIKVISHKFCALLLADALIDTERYLLKSSQKLDCPIVQVGHHGSKYASSEDFIRKLSPKVAIVSVNSSNLNDYPDEQVIKRWQNAGANVLNTSKVGDISIKVHPDGKYDVSTEHSFITY